MNQFKIKKEHGLVYDLREFLVGTAAGRINKFFFLLKRKHLKK